MPKVFNLLSPRTPWRLFLYFVNNLKTVGCYCGVCRRCGFLPSGVHGAENRRSHVGPSATRRATHRHEASPIAAFIKGISLEYAGILYIETLKPGKHANGNSANARNIPPDNAPDSRPPE